MKLSNSGKLPAQQINVHLLASAVFSSKIDACSLPPSPTGSILFPDHSNIHPVVTSIADDEIAKANTGRPRAEWLINPKVSVCIYYKSNLDDTTHRTRYSVHYRMAANKIKPERECCFIFVDDGRISADNLDVGIYPLADDFADLRHRDLRHHTLYLHHTSL